jgi:hypothetical protein
VTRVRVLVATLAALSTSVVARAAPDAGVPDVPTRLGTRDVCRLAVLAAEKRPYAPPHSTRSVLDEPATRERAGRRGKILMDVTVVDRGLRAHPLGRGETCGHAVLIESCHHGESPRRCAHDPHSEGAWRVEILLEIADPDHVQTNAALRAPVRRTKDGFRAEVSPVRSQSARFERRDGEWIETKL